MHVPRIFREITCCRVRETRARCTVPFTAVVSACRALPSACTPNLFSFTLGPLAATLVLHMFLALFASSSASHTPIFVCCRTPLRAMRVCFHFHVYARSTSPLAWAQAQHKPSIPSPISDNWLHIAWRSPVPQLLRPARSLLKAHLIAHCLR